MPFESQFNHGEMAEWSNAAVLKTVVPKGTGGSNPSLSATSKKWLSKRDESPRAKMGGSNRGSAGLEQSPTNPSLRHFQSIFR